MDVILFDNSKLTFEPTQKGLAIQLWQCGNWPDGHGWMLRSGVVLTPEEIETLRATLTPTEEDAGG